MTNPNVTDIVVVQDRSGSMNSCRVSSQAGINEFISAQKSGPGECFVTFVQFDDHIETLYFRKPIESLLSYSLVPRGWTALNDAIGQTINKLGQTYAELPEDQRPGKVYFVVNTDGIENSSKEFSGPQIKQLIEEQTSKYSWEFVFLAANQDAIATGVSYGFRADSSLTYDQNSPVAVAAAYSGASNAILRSRTSGGDAAASFTDEERAASVEKN